MSLAGGLRLDGREPFTELFLPDGIRTKRRTSRNGNVTGGQPFSRGALYAILRNRLYLGEITHQGTPLRIDGLAFIGGTLYGVLSFDDFVPAGIFSIDTSTWVATSVLPFPAGPAASGGLSGRAPGERMSLS